MKKDTLPLYFSIQHLSQDEDVSGILAVYRNQLEDDWQSTLSWDVLLMVIGSHPEYPAWTPVYLEGESQCNIVVLHITLHDLLSDDVLEYEEMRRWLFYASVEYDRDGQMVQYLRDFPKLWDRCQEHRILMKFSAFVRAYVELKRCVGSRAYLDAFSAAEQALLELARLSIVEHGQVPSSSLWQHVRLLDLGIHKLYEELVMSTETLDKRVELVLLACEFIISTRMYVYLSPLVRILHESHKGMNLLELCGHPDLVCIANEIPLLLDKLVSRGSVELSLVELDNTFSSIGAMTYYRWIDGRSRA
ncbi:hypothetical protein [Paenibacillus agilis]|uniref:YgxA-like substrate binding domain-containing protein n=1 Tax=Paenibacillus agilis TaxID=3020863 RepID=A0A559IGG8_9BACL|nr:hypothetical protein [Paenibacillus agilis]TVX86724.1 hypothetical protein FPZ44_22615 [Paenibacillus agilis]